MNDSPLRSLALFGATGLTGRAVLSEAVQRGISVRALCRPGSGPLPPSPRLQVLEGGLLDPARIAETIRGMEAVCAVFGPRPPYTAVFCARAMQLILEAMTKEGVRRLVCQTGAMIGKNVSRTLPFRAMGTLFRWRRPEAARDRDDQERLVRESAMEWTLIKPPRLTIGPRSARFRAGTNLRVGLLSSVSRADVAAFILDEIVQRRHIREAVILKG